MQDFNGVMIKLTLNDYWMPEDDVGDLLDKWVVDENAKIPPEIRENLRGFFPRIGLSADEADLIPASVAKYITVHSRAYKKYVSGDAFGVRLGFAEEQSCFEREFFAHLKPLYMVLAFYASFVTAVVDAGKAGELYVDEVEMRVGKELSTGEINQDPKTKEEERMFLFLDDVAVAISLFERTVPVEKLRYTEQVGYKIPRDMVSTYHAVPEFTQLLQLKVQAEEIFAKHGFVRAENNLFVRKEVGGI